MESQDPAIESFIDHAEGFSAFMGASEPDPQDRFILVMGLTGSGKSTFVGRCVNEDVVVGHGLQSCTLVMDVFTYEQAGHRVHLIDTPGLNDTSRSDADTLRILSTYLGASYANGVRIHGVILLHPISDNRMPGSSVRAMSMIQAVCGAAFCRHIAIATTMWPCSPDRLGTQTLREREKKLKADSRFFGAFIAEGACLFRHAEEGRRIPSEEQASARRIVEHLLQEADARPPDVLRIQRELIIEQKSVIDTTAGMIVGRDIYAVRREHQDQLRQLDAKMRSQLARTDDVRAAALAKTKKDVHGKLERLDDEKTSLQKSIRDLHSEEEALWRAKLEDMDAAFRARLARQETDLEDLRESLAWFRGQTSGDDVPTSTTEKQQIEVMKTEQEGIIVQAENEVSQTRKTYETFRGHSGEIIGGLANGVSATVATSIMTAVAGGLMCTLM